MDAGISWLVFCIEAGKEGDGTNIVAEDVGECSDERMFMTV